VAKANYSHTEGRDTTANGESSHAEGYVTTTSNQGEHAEGKYNISISGSTIHTVGIGTGASAKKNAHVITTDGKHYIPGIGTYTGIETTLPAGQDLATIVNSKVDTSNVVFEPSTGTGSAKLKNNQAIASGQYSTALGVSYNNTVQTAGGDASIVEGAGNITKSGAQAAHAEGVLNVAGRTQEEAVAALADFPNLGGTTEQKVSKLIGFGSHVEGTTNKALGTSSHAEGNSTQALVNATHAEGDSTTASGEAAHSEGYITTASGNQSHAEGYHTQATANQSHAEGKYTKATSENAHAEGNNTTANGNASHTEGFYTVANNNVEHAEGQYNVSISNVTCHTVGIGNSSQRKNAHTITTDGKHYIPGIGTYVGTETTLPSGQDLATIVNSKAPTSHASTSTTYGVGTTTNYGHVKTQTGDMNGTSSTNGIAAGLGHTHSQYSTTDTKNTAGSTDTSSKIYLIGATSQAANPQTYSDNEVYATSGVLTTKSVQVGVGAATMEYDSTNSCIKFVFN
jgi:hypothetical protein